MERIGVTRAARIVLVDDHAVVREGLARLFSREPDMEVVGEAATVVEAMRVCLSLRPDVVVLDVSLGRESALPVISALRRDLPGAAVLVLSMHDELTFAARALELGARGYVSKRERVERIVEAVRRVIAGRTVVSEEASELILGSLSGRAAGRARKLGIDALSTREMEILHLLATGASTSTIGRQLSISIKTVDAHRVRIKHKLGVKTALELVALAATWLGDGPAHTSVGAPEGPDDRQTPTRRPPRARRADTTPDRAKRGTDSSAPTSRNAHQAGLGRRPPR